MRSKSIFFEYGVKAIQIFFPPFESLNIKDVIGAFSDFHANFFIFNTYYSLAYLAVVLFLTVAIFERKKFEN